MCGFDRHWLRAIAPAVVSPLPETCLRNEDRSNVDTFHSCISLWMKD
jgi:hypothetical protein